MSLENSNLSSIQAKKNIFAYKNYRSFLSDWLKEKGLSYRAFVAKYPGAISFIALAKMLSKGKSGDKEKNDYKISPEALARLGKVIRLSDEELRRLILLRLENDADILQGPNGNAFQQVMRDLVAENIQKQSVNFTKRNQNENIKISATSMLLIDLFNLFPSKVRVKILEEIILHGKIYASRQVGKAGVKTLQSLMQELSQWKDAGAP